MPKKAVIKTMGSKNVSRQINDKQDSLFGNRDGVIEPGLDFEALLYAYENSSIIAGIIKKIAAKCNSGFEKTENDILNNMLQDLDIETIASNLLTFGNSFTERLKDGNKKNTLDFEPIMTHTIRVAKEKREADFYQRNKTGTKKVAFKKEEVLFIRRQSMSDRDYGDSLFAECLDEITLLAYITKYYKRFFERGNIEPNILYDKNGTLTEEQTEKIEEMIQDRISGVDTSHNTLFISAEVGKVDLTTKIDPDKFIALKRELKEDIAIATNIPFELLSPEDSNRATSVTALETLYSDIVVPLQTRILKQLKRQLKDWMQKAEKSDEKISDEDINLISFVKVDLKNSLDEMKTKTGYKNAGIVTANEVRAEMGYEEMEGGDDLIISGNGKGEGDEKSDEAEKIKKTIAKMYQKDV